MMRLISYDAAAKGPLVLHLLYCWLKIFGKSVVNCITDILIMNLQNQLIHNSRIIQETIVSCDIAQQMIAEYQEYQIYAIFMQAKLEF